MQNLKRKYYYYSFFFKTKKLRKNFTFYNIKTIEETIKDIYENKKSISRFGDGEFRLLIDDSGIGFQNGSIELTKKLRATILSTLPNHIVALPESFRLKNRLKLQNKYWWLNFINNVGVRITNFLNPKKIYGNSFISRFYLIFENKNNVPFVINELKKIWDNQNILIVEGKYSRLGVGNDLFDNTKSLQRILCPERDAFSKYEEILEVIRNHGKDKLILIALGPTATAMAYDLAKENFWALDIGHVDLEYMWYLMGVNEKSPVEGRLVNETADQLSLELPDNERKKYEKSILLKLT